MILRLICRKTSTRKCSFCFTIQYILQHLFLTIIIISIESSVKLFIKANNKVIGYIGPSCAVVEDLLYMHGVFSRKLSNEEVQIFHNYQSDLEVYRQLKRAIFSGVASAPENLAFIVAPKIPKFCNGLDDSIEVVLDGCLIRHNKIYVADQMIRPLNNLEQMKIDALLKPNFAQRLMKRKRKRRSIKKYYTPPQLETNNLRKSNIEKNRNLLNFNSELLTKNFETQLADFLGHFFNVNASIAERFIKPKVSRILSNYQQKTNLNDNDKSDSTNETSLNTRETKHSNDLHTLKLVNTKVSKENQDPELPLYVVITPTNNTKVIRKTGYENRVTEIKNSTFDAKDTHIIPSNQIVTGTKSDIDYATIDSNRDLTALNQPHYSPEYVPQTGSLNMNDPILLHLLHSLAKQQQNVNQIIENIQKNEEMEQQQQQQQTQMINTNPEYIYQSSLPNFGTKTMRPGEKILIGGQIYVAVPLNSFAASSNIPLFNNMKPKNTVPTIGLMPTEMVMETIPQAQQIRQNNQQKYSIPEVLAPVTQIRYGTGTGVFPPIFQQTNNKDYEEKPTSNFHQQTNNFHPQTNVNNNNDNFQTMPFNQTLRFQLSNERFANNIINNGNKHIPHEICQNLFLENTSLYTTN